LEIPRIVKLSVVAMFDDARVEVKVDNILIRGGVAKEDTFEVVTIESATMNP
jgi:hypothetical protein